MARFNRNQLANAAGIGDAVDSAIAGANLATDAELAAEVGTINTALGGKASTASVNTVAADLRQGAGRPLTADPANFTGTGGVQTLALALPDGYTIGDGAKAKIKGTALVRTPGGQRLARVAIDNLIVMRTPLTAWDAGTAAALGYDTGARVANEGHGWVSTVDNNVQEPTVALSTGWTDLGGPMTHAWDEVSPADTVPTTEAGVGTYFASEADLPAIADNGPGGLALEFTAINGEDVRVEFDGTISNIGVN